MLVSVTLIYLFIQMLTVHSKYFNETRIFGDNNRLVVNSCQIVLHNLYRGHIANQTFNLSDDIDWFNYKTPYYHGHCVTMPLVYIHYFNCILSGTVTLSGAHGFTLGFFVAFVFHILQLYVYCVLHHCLSVDRCWFFLPFFDLLITILVPSSLS